MQNILFVASECTPFIKTGGLADVIGSLPQALKEYERMDVSVILPLYDEISEEWKSRMEYHSTFNVPLGWRNQEAGLYSLKLNQITYYFLANDYYFTRKGIYGYYDDGERFVFFSRAVIEALGHLEVKPDILHAHDWQAGMTIPLVKIIQPIAGLKTVFSIHNLKYQGVMPMDTFHDFLGLPPEHMGGFEWNGALNCLKSALYHTDKITTVSPSYAEEIKDPYYGEGLDPILIQRQADLIGILNGIDTKEYNPLTDPALVVNYRSARARKMENKKAIQDMLGLPVNSELPLYVMITRLVEQKGMHLIQHILDEFMQSDIQFVILGTGDPEFEHYFSEVSQRYPDKMKSILQFDEGLARQLYAGADFFVMPSKFEPCGLAQLIALQYKTIPIVRETGGLKDTVQSFNEWTMEGNGFSFAHYNAHDLLSILRYSLSVYHSPTLWSELVKNVNRSQFSWKHSAQEYGEIYEKLITQYA